MPKMERECYTITRDQQLTAGLTGRVGLGVQDCRLLGVCAGDISGSSSYVLGLRVITARKRAFEGVLQVEIGADLFVFPTDQGLYDSGTEDDGSLVFERGWYPQSTPSCFDLR